MPKSDSQVQEVKAFNPFYVLLLISGVVFAITTCAYGVMMLQMGRAQPLQEDSPGAALMQFLDCHGMTVLGIELAVLAVTTFAAIGFDDYFTKRAQAKADPPQQGS